MSGPLGSVGRDGWGRPGTAGTGEARGAAGATVGSPPRLRLSLRLNNDLPPSQFLEIATAAEEAGFDQLWVSHDLLLRSAPVLLAAAARETSRIKLGAGVLNPYSAHPVELAMHAATLQELSGGRALLGIGAGAAGLLGAAGVPRPEPLARTRAALASCRAMLGAAPSAAGPRPGPASTEAAASGRAPAAEARLAIPLPVPVPVYLGAMGPRMLELAGELADGALALLYPPEHYPLARSQVLLGAERAGRSPGELDLPACVWVSVDEDRAAAEAALADKLAFFGQELSPYLLARAGMRPEDFAPAKGALEGGDRSRARSLVTPAMLRLGIAGTPEEVASRCAGLVLGGAAHLSFGPPLGPDPLRAVGTLSRQVVPLLEEAVVAWRAQPAGSSPGEMR